MSFRVLGLLLCGGLMVSVLVVSAEGQEKKKTETTGACVYNAGAKTYCAVVSQSNCTTLKGTWTSGGKCP